MSRAGRGVERSQTRQIAGWLLGGLLARGAIASLLPAGFDEAYYYLYTQHLDWSYFDHPVMVALSTGFGPWLTGQVSPLTIRLGALLWYTGALLGLFFAGRRLFSVQAAGLTVAIASLVPIFAIGFGILTLPDSPLMFFWATTFAVASAEFFRPVAPYRPSFRLALMGLLVGLACLSKYHGLALGAGLVGFCLTSSTHRKALISPWTLGAGALFILAIAPIVVWNMQHDWVSFRFQAGRALPNRGYSLLELLGVWLVGIAYLFPSFGLPLWWVAVKSLWEQSSGGAEQQKDRSAVQSTTVDSQQSKTFVLWLSLPLMLSFTLMGGYRPILPTWAMPGFFGMTLVLGAVAAEWQETSPRGVRRWLWGSGWAIAALVVIALSHLTLGTFQKPSQYALFGGVVPASADASIQMVDIGQLRQGIAESPALTAALAQADFGFTSEIFLAGQVAMAIAPFHPLPMDCFTDDIRGFAFWFTANQWVGKSGLYFTSHRLLTADTYANYFQHIQSVGEVPIRRGGETIETIQIYLCQRLLKSYPRQLQTPPL